MRNNVFLSEIVVSFVLIILLVLFINPFGLFMPTTLLMMLIVGFLIVFGIFASFIFRENAKDERESFHRMLAGRVAFLTGSGSLVLGIVIQSLNHNLDLWLVFALGAMILAKIIGLIYGRIKY